MALELFSFINIHSQATPTRVTLSALEMCLLIPLPARDMGIDSSQTHRPAAATCSMIFGNSNSLLLSLLS